MKEFQSTSVTLSFKRVDDIESIENAWNELGSRLSHFHFYHKPAWFKAYKESLFSPNNQLFFVTIHADNTLLGLVPLEYICIKKLAIPLKVLRLPFNSHLDLSDCLIDESIYKMVLEQLVEFINCQKDLKWDVFFMGGTAENSHANHIFASATVKQNIKHCYTMQSGASSYIQCEGNYNDSVAHISSKFKRNVARLERKAEKQGDIHYLSYACNRGDQPELFQQYYQAFLAVEADSWRAEIGTAIKDNPPAARFYEKLGSYFSAPDTCIINLLKLNNEVIAVQFGIQVGERLNLLKIGFRKNYKNIGPGNIIFNRTLKNSINEGLKIVSTTTAPPWAEKWKSDSVKVYRHFIFNQTFAGFLAKRVFLLYPSYKRLKLQWLSFQAIHLKKNVSKGTS